MKKQISSPFALVVPQNCINAKIRKMHRLLNSVYSAKFKPFDLQGSMVSILFIIGKQQRINQKKLADALVLDQSTMSRDVNKLLSKGLVLLSKGKDPRHTELRMSSKGIALLAKLAPIWLELHGKVDALLGQFNVQQIDTISIAIQTNLENLKK